MALETLRAPVAPKIQGRPGNQHLASVRASGDSAQIRLGTFSLLRRRDMHGISGIGTVAEGVRFSDGTVVLHWLRAHRTTRVFPSLRQVIRVHGHGGNTRVVWDAPRAFGAEVQ